MHPETHDSTVTETTIPTEEEEVMTVEVVNGLLAARVGTTVAAKLAMDMDIVNVNVSVTTHAKSAVLAHRQAPRAAAARALPPSLLARLLLPRRTP